MFNFFKRKNKVPEGLNVIDFTNTCWGHNYNLINANDTSKIEIVCWYTNSILGHIDKGALFLSKGERDGKTGYFFGRIVDFERYNDPDDMYSLTVKALRSTDEMNPEEIKYLDKYIQVSNKD